MQKLTILSPMQLPDVISTMSKAGKAGCENLEWREEFTDNIGVFSFFFINLLKGLFVTDLVNLLKQC